MATTVDFTFLLALFVFLAFFFKSPVKNRSRFGVGTSLGRKNIGKTLGISIFGRLLGFANTLCVQAFLVLLWAVSLGPKIEEPMTSKTPIGPQSDDIYKAGNRANRNRNDKQGCIWLNLLAASLYHCPILLPCDVLSQWPYRKHRASDCTSWRRVDHLPMSWRPQVVEKTTSNLGKWNFEHDIAKKKSKGLAEDSFLEYKKTCGKRRWDIFCYEVHPSIVSQSLTNQSCQAYMTYDKEKHANPCPSIASHILKSGNPMPHDPHLHEKNTSTRNWVKNLWPFPSELTYHIPPMEKQKNLIFPTTLQRVSCYPFRLVTLSH